MVRSTVCLFVCVCACVCVGGLRIRACGRVSPGVVHPREREEEDTRVLGGGVEQEVCIVAVARERDLRF